ncbi:hypothetical protein L1D31_21750 [Vibrio sp. Isolate23]|uniref:hypothetical protein n=1 Tax=Vibrio sp. Isolate23 TaxID=2908533 RepID=UPI001AC1070F|nr:hypothetical protein [Vibrio sp. Isolate23]MBO0165072.1 hypothetical protein [Vibrio alginolyticus]MCG9685150.1 hypothetical protein [Vibrio sp. Isolate23]
MRLSHKRKIAHKKGAYQPRLVSRVKFRWPHLLPGEKVCLMKCRTGMSRSMLHDEMMGTALFTGKPLKVVMSCHADDCLKSLSLAAKRLSEVFIPKKLLSLFKGSSVTGHNKTLNQA